MKGGEETELREREIPLFNVHFHLQRAVLTYIPEARMDGTNKLIYKEH